MKSACARWKSILPLLEAPKLWGAEDAQVTLVGWGSTEGVVQEAIQKLADEEGIAANLLQIKWLVPLHGEAITATLSKSKKAHHRREQLQRPVRALSTLGDRHRRRRSHSQV